MTNVTEVDLVHRMLTLIRIDAMKEVYKNPDFGKHQELYLLNTTMKELDIIDEQKLSPEIVGEIEAIVNHANDIIYQSHEDLLLHWEIDGLVEEEKKK